MNPEMEESLRAYNVCKKEIEDMKYRAIQGDGNAALMLVDLGVFTTQAVQELWFKPSIYNPFNGKGGKQGLPWRREFLSFWLSGMESLPTLHPRDSQQQEMLTGIEFGPFKARKRKKTDMKTLLEIMIRPKFESYRHEPKRPSGIEGQIWDLSPLSPESVQSWADLIVAWVWEKHKGKMTDVDSWLYALARPERGLIIDQQRRTATLRDRLKKRKERGGGEMGIVEKTWSKHEEGEIRKMVVTHAHIKNGLKSEIVKYWRRHLAPSHASKNAPSQK